MSERSLGRGGDRAGRVLIVDDEPQICMLLQRILGRWYTVDTHSGDPREILDVILTGASYDVILYDMTMSGVDAPGLYELVQVNCPDMEQRIIVMSGGMVAERYFHFVDERKPAVVQKPFDVEALSRRISALLDEQVLLTV